MGIRVRIIYYIVYGIAYAVSLLPLRVLYVLSDGLFYLVYYVVGYRRRLVRKNLRDSFPGESESGISRVERDFYAWLCDYLVETVKLLSAGKRQMTRRMRFEGVERVRESIARGRSCAIYLGHYCNWEWVTSLPLALGDSAVCAQIYHVLENPAMDRLFLSLRGRMGAVSIPMAETLRHIAKYRSEGRPVVIGFISDQVPFWNNIHYWTDFLRHDTPVLTGTERIARSAGFDVYYLDMRRDRRGYYTGEFRLLSDNPASLPEFGLTEMYFRALEKTIERQPQFWLWTHNRWKRTRKEWERIIDPVTRKMRT